MYQQYKRHVREEQEEMRRVRNAVWRKLSPRQQLAELDRRLGEGIGATKQRAKIAAKLVPVKK
jgi:hypothetical protein